MRTIVLLMFMLLALSSCYAGSGMLGNMESGSKLAGNGTGQKLVVFMSLKSMFPDKKVRALAEAAGNGDVHKIEKLVAEGVDVNARGRSNATPLFWAMRNYRGFLKLLELGANPNIVFNDGGSVMDWAVTAKDNRFLKAALAHGGNPNLTAGKSKETPLLRATGPGGKDKAKILLDAGADINLQGGYANETPIMAAAELGQFDLVYLLLERGADVTIKDKLGWNLLDILAKSKITTDPNNMSPQYIFLTRWMEKDIEWLKQRGINLPKQLPKPKHFQEKK